MRAVAVVGSKGKEVTVVERECSASDRLDTRRGLTLAVSDFTGEFLRELLQKRTTNSDIGGFGLYKLQPAVR